MANMIIQYNKMENKKNNNNGIITQVIGAVVDVYFEEKLPSI